MARRNGFQTLNDAPKGVHFRDKLSNNQNNGDIINPPNRLKGWSNPTKQRNSLNVQRPGKEK